MYSLFCIFLSLFLYVPASFAFDISPFAVDSEPAHRSTWSFRGFSLSFDVRRLSAPSQHLSPFIIKLLSTIILRVAFPT
jgi:hypothetical protein